MKTILIYCCGCAKEISARLASGKEIYPHRSDLASLPFWKCDACGNHVGCHHKTKNRTKPLGDIPTPEIREARKRIHAVLDPIWKSGRMDRNSIYREISEKLGYDYHTGNIASTVEAEVVCRIVKGISERERV